MLLIDPAIITTRLTMDLEQLFQVSNQAFYLGRIHPSSVPLTLQMGNRIYYVTNDLAEILRGLEPKGLTIEDAMSLANYAEIKRGMVQSWQWIEQRGAEILRQAKARLDQQGGAGQ